MPDSIVLVDDDENQRHGLTKVLQGWGFIVQEAGSVEEATEKILNSPPTLVITDLVMPGAGGVDLLRAIRPDYNGSVIVLSGRGTIEKAVEAIKEGAEDFVEKPVNFPKLRVLLEKIREKGEIIRENRRLREELARHGSFGQLRGKSARMREVYCQSRRSLSPSGNPSVLPSSERHS